MSFFSRIFNTNKKKEPDTASSSRKKVQLTDMDKKQLTADITTLNKQIEQSSDANTAAGKKEKAAVLTKLGQDYQKLGANDKAIAAYEQSLHCNEDFGPAFDGLLQLYDVKRQEAAYAGNNDEIQKWLNKSDELTALSKKIMRSK